MTDHQTRVTGGVDTHRDEHVAAALDERGGQLGVKPFPATSTGYQDLLAWLNSFGVIERVGVEGTGCYGAGLSRHLQAAGVEIVEVDRPNRQLRRRAGKSDPVDAVAAARAAQSGQATAVAKSADGDVEKLRALRLARASARHSRVRVINQLRALMVTAPDELRAEFTGLTAITLPQRCARFRVPDPTTNLGALKYAMRSLARQAVTLRAEIKDLDRVITTLVNQTAPELLGRHGVGPDSAAVLLIAAGDNPDRLRSEAAFARMCGAAPLEASSGPTVRHRLSRAGNRQANAALHSIVLTRMVSHPETRTYVARRRAEGKTSLEIMRCLKRFVAREIYHQLAPT